MKNRGLYLTPGQLYLTVKYDPNWRCGCPGVHELVEGDTYLITGVVHRIPGKRYLLVYHKSLVKPWSESILDDMANNKPAYPGLIFRPSLKVYRRYFPG